MTEQIKQTALLAHRSDNPSRVLKAVIDMMKQRYASKLYERLNLEAILKEIGLTDLKTNTRLWLFEVRVHLTITYTRQNAGHWGTSLSELHAAGGPNAL